MSRLKNINLHFKKFKSNNFFSRINFWSRFEDDIFSVGNSNSNIGYDSNVKEEDDQTFEGAEFINEIVGNC